MIKCGFRGPLLMQPPSSRLPVFWQLFTSLPFHPLSLFLDPFVTTPHCPFPSVSPSNQTAAGPAEWCLGRRPGGCSGSVGRRLHHRLRPGLLLPPLLQQPRLLVGTTQHCTALNHVTPSSRMCVTVLPVSSTPEKKVDGRISLSS